MADVDWQWHIPLRDLADAEGNPGGLSALSSLVAQLQSTPLLLDRPPWRFVVATGFAPERSRRSSIVNHAVGDGLQILAQTGALLEPTAGVAVPLGDRPGFVRRALGTVIGLAQLATDGRHHHLLPSGHGVRWQARGAARGVAGCRPCAPGERDRCAVERRGGGFESTA